MQFHSINALRRMPTYRYAEYIALEQIPCGMESYGKVKIPGSDRHTGKNQRNECDVNCANPCVSPIRHMAERESGRNDKRRPIGRQTAPPPQAECPILPAIDWIYL